LRYEVQDLVGDVRKELRNKGDRSDDVCDRIEDSIELLALDVDLYLKEKIGRESSL
jgi:hypothetical protein